MKGRQENPGFFGQARGSTHEQTISSTSLQRKFQQARKDGHLNISSCKPPLESIPAQVFQLDAFLESNEKFWEIEPLRLLDISFNAIRTIPPEIGNLTTIHTLKARSNKIQGELPPSLFAGCQGLRHLDLSQNELVLIPPEVHQANELRELYLSNNRLSTVPESLFHTISLRLLDLSHNSIEDLPREINLPNLVTFNLNNNRLRFLPSLTTLPMLETLNLAANQVAIMPDMSLCRGLKTLDATQNLLTEFPTLPQSRLSQLMLGYNRILVLNTSLLMSQGSLSELLLHNNRLSVLPPELEYLQALKVLDVSNNDLQDLPATLGYITTLQILKVDGNRIKSIRQSLLLRPAAEIKTYLRSRGPSMLSASAMEEFHASDGPVDIDSRYVGRSGVKSGAPVASTSTIMQQVKYRIRDAEKGTVDLSNLQLTTLDLEVVELIQQLPIASSLTAINLARNAFTTLPGNILDMLPQIRTLIISQNNLSVGSVMDAESARLSYIVSLNISQNKLTTEKLQEILLSFPRLAELEELIIDRNPVVNLPSLIVECRGLKVFKAANCNLTAADVLDFQQLSSLEQVDLSDNKLTRLPESVHFARRLQLLSIENNELREIPSILGTLPSLRTLLVNGNPQRAVRPQVIAQGSAKVIDYLRAKHGVDTDGGSEWSVAPYRQPQQQSQPAQQVQAVVSSSNSSSRVRKVETLRQVNERRLGSGGSGLR